LNPDDKVKGIMAGDGQEQARQLLAELIEAAKKGSIIPVRLPGQLEAIQKALETPAPAASEATVSTGGGDLEQYKKDIGAMLAHGFHDLRLPLTSIRGYSDMMVNPAMGSLTDMQKQFLTTIRVNTKRLESLLNDVSDMQKLWNGTLKLAPKMDMFKNIAMAVEKQMQPLATELKRTLTFEIPPGLPLLTLDGDMLVKALNKLVENAVRYTPEGGSITVSAVGEGSLLHITIVDTGMGMTADELAKIGTPYFRSDREEVLAFKGSGLGIPVAQGLIKLLGGTISFNSEVGAGTTVRVTLPGTT
jgi:signal transduction histidine kinase